MDFTKKAEEVWDEVKSNLYEYDFRNRLSVQDIISAIAAALEQAYREGVEAMRDAAKKALDNSVNTYSFDPYEAQMDKVANVLLSKSEEVGK